MLVPKAPIRKRKRGQGKILFFLQLNQWEQAKKTPPLQQAPSK